MHNFILRLTVMFPFMSALIGAKTLEPRQSEKLFNKTQRNGHLAPPCGITIENIH